MKIMTEHGIKQPKEGVARFWLSFMAGVRSERAEKIKNKDGEMDGQAWGRV